MRIIIIYINVGINNNDLLCFKVHSLLQERHLLLNRQDVLTTSKHDDQDESDSPGLEKLPLRFHKRCELVLLGFPALVRPLGHKEPQNDGRHELDTLLEPVVLDNTIGVSSEARASAASAAGTHVPTSTAARADRCRCIVGLTPCK